MTTNGAQARNATASFAGQSDAANGLALVRVTVGAMFVWVFFENLGKGLYSPSAYSDLINYYIQKGHSPAAWKAVMALAASHAHMAAPMQAATEITLGILLVTGLVTRPAAFVAFLFLGSLWVSELGTSTTGSGGRIARTRGGTRRSCLGRRRVAGTAAPSIPVVVMRDLRASVSHNSYP